MRCVPASRRGEKGRSEARVRRGKERLTRRAPSGGSKRTKPAACARGKRIRAARGRGTHGKTRSLGTWRFFGPLRPGWGEWAEEGCLVVVSDTREWFLGGARKSASCRLAPERAHRVLCFHCYKSPEQEAKSQQIVGQSLLSCLQYPVPYISRLQRIYPSQHSKLRWSMMLGRSLS